MYYKYLLVRAYFHFFRMYYKLLKKVLQISIGKGVFSLFLKNVLQISIGKGVFSLFLKNVLQISIGKGALIVS